MPRYYNALMRPDLFPEFHFLMIAPSLGAEWLFDAARVYWDRYRPTIITDFEFVRLIPPDRAITVTVIARRDSAPALGVELAQAAPTAYFDAVIHELFDEMKAALNDRVERNMPFGVPLSAQLPEEGAGGAGAAIPTPWLPPTHPPAGFVTATPTTPPPTQVPPTTDPNVTPPATVERTPGPIIGGGG